MSEFTTLSAASHEGAGLSCVRRPCGTVVGLRSKTAGQPPIATEFRGKNQALQQLIEVPGADSKPARLHGSA